MEVMQSLKGVVRNGRLIVDEPTALPEGTEVELVAVAGGSARSRVPAPGPSPIGLMADEPELMDQVVALAYRARRAARLRTFDV